MEELFEFVTNPIDTAEKGIRIRTSGPGGLYSAKQSRSGDPDARQFVWNVSYAFLDVAGAVQAERYCRPAIERWGCRLEELHCVLRRKCFNSIQCAMLDQRAFTVGN